MNIEMNDNLMGKIRFHIRDFANATIAVAHTAIRRRAKKHVRRERPGNAASADRERYHAEATALLHQARLYR